MKTDRALQQPGQYNFSDVGIDLVGQSHRTQVEWSNIYKVLETDTALMLFVSSQAFFLIPKRFLTLDQTTGIRLLIRSHVCAKVELR